MSTRVRVTFDEYEEMVRRGEFEPRARHHVELIQGEIRPMSPIGVPQSNLIMWLDEWSHLSLPARQVWVRIQLPIGIPALDSEPQPDIVWFRRDATLARHPRPEDVLLVVEVSDSSLDFDRGEKAELYAAAGIADYWVVNVREACVEVHRRPEGTVYRDREIFGIGQEVRPLAFPDVALIVSDLFAAAS